MALTARSFGAWGVVVRFTMASEVLSITMANRVVLILLIAMQQYKLCT